ncbi:MAG: hypothetical protein KF881_02810 [Acidobacteria bacterium]|nr:hypothetical protein [Acidobacteriota bacterium]
MAQVFKCESCSGPLEYEGGKTQKCGFCGSTILVPRYLYSDDPAADHSSEPKPNELADLTQKAFIFAEIKKLIAENKKIHAIKLYHERFGGRLADAKDAVDRLERGEPIKFESISLTKIFEPLSQIKVDTAAAKRVGGYFLTFIVLGGLAVFVIAAIIIGAWLKTRSTADASPEERPIRAAEMDSSGELMRFGGEGTGVGRFTDNRVVAVDNKGNVYSTDYNGGRIQIFDQEGNFLRQWTANGASIVFAMAPDRSGNLFVLGNKGIGKYTSLDGEEKARYEDPRLRDIHVKPDGSVIAVGRQGIVFLDKDLVEVKTFREASAAADASFGFESVTADAAGTMYLLDRRGKDIIKFSSEGKFLNRFPAELNSPNDIALDPSGNIYVTETSVIRVFTPTGKQIGASQANQAFGITFNDAGEVFVAARPYVIKRRPLLLN